MQNLMPTDMTQKVKGAYLQLLLGKEQHEYQKMLRGKLSNQNVPQIQSETWYDSDVLSQTLHEIDNDFGSALTHKIGADFANNLVLNVQPNDLRGAIQALLELCSKHHKTAEGYQNQSRYFQEDTQEALLEIYLPYPYEFMKGCILALAKKYQPKFAIKTKVELLNECDCMHDNKTPCLYRITWLEV